MVATVAFGSCYRSLAYPNRVMERLYRLISGGISQYGFPPLKFFLMVGDQIYADASGIDPGNKKWEAMTFPEYCEIYRRCWGEDPFFRRVRSCCPTYIIFDDHRDILTNVATKPVLMNVETAIQTTAARLLLEKGQLQLLRKPFARLVKLKGGGCS